MADAGTRDLPRSKSRFIGGIDGLRAFAVLSVILYHLNASLLPGGYVGVDIFFVISGFVVAHSVFDTGTIGFSRYFIWFYRRRFTRILPALFAYVIVAVVVGIAFIPVSPATKFIEFFGISSIFGVSNVALLWKAGAYFSSSSEYNTFTHTWSLAIEEQYYFLFPILSYFLIIRRHEKPFLRRMALALTYAACISSLIACYYFTRHWQEFAFYMLPTRFWELGVGLLLRCQFTDASERAAPRITGTVQSAGLVALAALVGSFWLTRPASFPFPDALWPCIATVVLIAILWLRPGSWIERLLAHPALRYIGKISYSLYLWHWGVIVLLRWTVGLDRPAVQVMALALMFGLAIASYALVERPARTARWLKAAGGGRFFLSFAAIAGGLSAACLMLALAKPALTLSITGNTAVWSPYTRPPIAAGGCPVDMASSGFHGDKHLSLVPKCPAPGSRTLFVLGDSHAGAYQRMLYRVASSDRMTVELYTHGGCPALHVTGSEPLPGCGEFVAAALADIARRAKRDDVVFLPALYTPRYRDEWGIAGAMPAFSGPVGRGRLMLQSEQVVAGLARMGLKIVIEAPKPTVPTASFRCADWFDRANPYCATSPDVPRAEMEARRAGPLAALRHIAASSPAARLWDPLPVLCGRDTCAGFVEGKPLYFDTDHLSGFGNDVLTASFRNAITARR